MKTSASSCIFPRVSPPCRSPSSRSPRNWKSLPRNFTIPFSRNSAPNTTTQFRAEYDDTGSIGKRYRRQDEIGTPFCVTFDFDTLNDNAVTVRDRDSMTQERIAIDQLAKFLDDKINPEI